METINVPTPRRRGRRAAAESDPAPAGEAELENKPEGSQETEAPRRRGRRAAAEEFVPPAGSGVDKNGNLQATSSKETLELLEEYYREVERNEEAKAPLQEQMKALRLSNSTVYRKVKALGIRKQAFMMGLYRRKLTKDEAAALDLENTIAARAAGVPIQADLFEQKPAEASQTIQ